MENQVTRDLSFRGVNVMAAVTQLLNIILVSLVK